MELQTPGDSLVTLSQVAERINDWFGLDEHNEIKYMTPFIWWDRSKKNKDISLPMPHPTLKAGRSFAWRQDQIFHWYGQWTNVEVPIGRPAGDVTDNRGNLVVSEYRVDPVTA